MTDQGAMTDRAREELSLLGRRIAVVGGGGKSTLASAIANGPFSSAECPALDDLVGEGMKRTREGQIDGVEGKCDWLELHYTFDSAEWRQRRAIVPLAPGLFALVTSQAISPNAQAAFDAAEEIASSLALMRD